MYEGYMTYGGVEIVNSARAKVYAENGLVPTSVALNCGCDSIPEAIGDDPYTSVIIDQPPWYDPADPYPNDFAGVIPLTVTGLSGSTRVVEVMERLGDGGIPVRGRAASRTIGVTAALVGRSSAGIDAGMNWLSAILHPPCAVAPSGCSGETLQMFAACPETCDGITDPDATPETSTFLTSDLRAIGGDLTGGVTPTQRHNLVTHPSFELQSGGAGTAPDGWTGFEVGQNGTVAYNLVSSDVTDGITSQAHAVEVTADAQGYGGPSGANLLTGDNSTFEASLGDWGSANGATLSRTNAVPGHGIPLTVSYAMQVTWPTGGIPAAQYHMTGLTSGQPYTFSVWVYVPSGQPDLALQIFEVMTGEAITVKDKWEKVQVSWIATGTDDWVQVLASGGSTNGEYCYVDDAEVRPGYPGWRFDSNNLQGWVGANGATVVATDAMGDEEGQLAHNSAGQMKVTWPTGGFPAAQYHLTGLVVGQPYTFTAWVYVPVGSVDVAVSVWLVGEGPIMSTKSAWTQLQMTFIASQDNHWLQVVPKGEHTAGEACYVDDAYVTYGGFTFTDGCGLTLDLDASAGTTYYGRADLTLVNLPAGHDAALYLIAHDAGHTVVASHFAVGDPTVHTQTLTVGPFVAPTNTDHIQVSLQVYGNGGGWEVNQPVDIKWDSVLVTTGSPTDYFDGASAATEGWTYAWDGAPNASASTASGVAGQFVEFVPDDPSRGGTLSTPLLGPICDVVAVAWDVVNTSSAPITVWADMSDAAGTVVVGSPSHSGPGGADVLNPAALDLWWDALANRDNAPANLVCLGDSITEGVGTPEYQWRWQELFRHRARDRYPITNVANPGQGWMPAVNAGGPQPPTTLAGSPTTSTSGPGLGVKCLRVATGQSVTWPQAWCDRVTVMFHHATASAGRGTISIDGVDAATIQSSAGSTAGGQVWDSGPLPPGLHTLSIRGIDANPVVLAGAEFHYGDYGRGIHTYDAGHSGAVASTFLGAAQNTGHWLDYEALEPAATVINIGVNETWADPAQMLTDLDSLIAACDTHSDRGDGRGPRPIVLVVPYRPVKNPHTDQAEANFDTYCDGIRARAGGHIAVYDLRAHWPILTEGNGYETGVMAEDDFPLHPNTNGHDAIADDMMTVFAPEVVTVYGTSIPVGGSTHITVTADPSPGFPNDWTSTLHTSGDAQINPVYTARPEIALQDCVDPLIRTFRNVVTVAGPTEVARYADQTGDTFISTVEWTMVAGEPYAYGVETTMATYIDSSSSIPPSGTAPGVIVTNRTSIDHAGTVCALPAPPSVYCNDDPAWMGLPSPPSYPVVLDTTAPEVLAYWRRTMQMPNPPGVAALVLTIVNDTLAKKGLRVRVWHETDCDLAMPDECGFDTEFTIDYLGPSATLIIDSADRTAMVTCPDGSWADHTRNLRGNYGGPFTFPIVGCGDCSRVAVDVPQNYVTGGVAGLEQGNVEWSVAIAHRMG
jgi:lysophospholipase L1-like esterase